MEKKNPYVMTIGFNRRDPNHREVAEFLNGIERGKAQYIVNAVMAYHDASKENFLPELDKAAIRKIIHELLEEEGYVWNKSNRKRNNDVPDVSDDKRKKYRLEEEDVLNIMDSLNAFRKV